MPREQIRRTIKWFEGFEKELRERLEANIKQLKEIPSSTKTRHTIEIIAELLDVKIGWKYVNGYPQVKEISGDSP